MVRGSALSVDHSCERDDYEENIEKTHLFVIKGGRDERMS